MDRRFPKIALALALAVLPLAACTESPETEFQWGVNDHVARRAPAARSQAAGNSNGPRVYVYQDNDGSAAAPPTPTPRPAYQPAPVYASTRPAPAYTPTAPTGSVSFAWPVSGDVISSFGAAANGERNDGINIAARMNTPIRAAASGTVNYADTLNGYGKLVLIRHADGYVTAYAHADRFLVSQGDFVAKGQVIGYTGQTGDVTSPQLHFEIRHDAKPVDPRRLLAARAGA